MRRSVAAAAMCGLAAAAVVLPADAAGRSSWKADRVETFGGSSLPEGCGSYSGTYTAGASAWTAKQVDVSDGRLKLSLAKRRTNGQPYASGGVGCWGWAQKYGRYEIKARVPAGKGIDSYLTLWPTSGGASSATAWTGIELLAPGTQTAHITNGYGRRSETARVRTRFASAFHTYVIEWAPMHLRMTIDGKEIYYSTRSYTGKRWLGMVVSNGDALTGVPARSAKLPLTFQIERVAVSRYTGVPPKRERSSGSGDARVDGVPTPVATTVPPGATAKAPPSSAGSGPSGSPTAAVPPLQNLSADRTAYRRPALAGGIWPWLVGGSLIALLALGSLNYPHRRRASRSATPLR